MHLGGAGGFPRFASHMYPTLYRGTYAYKLGRRTITSGDGRCTVVRGTCRVKCTGTGPPGIHAKGGITIVNSNPSKLTTTSLLGEENRRMAIFRHRSGPNKLLHCKVPGVGLRGRVVSHGVTVVRRRKVVFRAKYGIKGSIGTTSVLGRCSHIVLTYKTSGPESVGTPKESTRKVCFTMSFLGSAAGTL